MIFFHIPYIYTFIYVYIYLYIYTYTFFNVSNDHIVKTESSSFRFQHLQDECTFFCIHDYFITYHDVTINCITLSISMCLWAKTLNPKLLL